MSDQPINFVRGQNGAEIAHLQIAGDRMNLIRLSPTRAAVTADWGMDMLVEVEGNGDITVIAKTIGEYADSIAAWAKPAVKMLSDLLGGKCHVETTQKVKFNDNGIITGIDVQTKIVCGG